MTMVDGVHLEFYGPDDAPTIVLIHGLASDGRYWRPLVELMQDRFQLVTVDVPGFGRSGLFENVDPDEGNDYELEAVAERIGAALLKMGVEEHALVGHSFGGGLATVFATLFPERVTHLALLAPAGFSLSPESIRSSWTNEHLGRAIRVASFVALPLLALPPLRRLAFQYHVVNTDQLSARDTIALGRSASSARQGGPAGVAIVTAGLLPLLEQLEMPTLIAWGAQDRIVSPKMAKKLQAKLPDAEVISYPDTGHALIYEPGNAQKVADDLAKLVARA